MKIPIDIDGLLTNFLQNLKGLCYYFVMKNVEILAPVGNFESLEAAIGCGADAVYLGLDELNARANIQNFNIQNIGDVIARAHLFGVKVYITLNILISDAQMEGVLKVVETLLQLKVDAFIVQDLGLAFCIKQKFPNAVLHASTQMGICNLEGARFLEKLGFSRVVLARETGLDEIERIHKNCNIEIEFFVQGALCVSYSGNCYISAINADASGNRGKCKQFCRLPYTLQAGQFEKKGYLLSAKDFCMLEKLETLAEAGVVSFKIEGRARRAGYVAAATAVYRQAIDAYEANKQPKFDVAAGKEILKKAFNRGDFISGYFEDTKILDSNIQGHRGVAIGKVLNVSFGKRFNVVRLKCNHKLVRGDGLKFILDGKEICSIGVNDVKEISKGIFEITTTAKVKKDCDVNLTLDVQNEEKLLKKQRKIDVFCKFYANVGKTPALSLRDKNSNVQVLIESEEPCDKAKTMPTSVEEVKEQLCKGSEMFELHFEKIELENVFLRKAQLNQMRRVAFEKLKEEIVKKYEEANIFPFVESNASLQVFEEKKQKQQILLFSDLKQLQAVPKENCKLVYCPEQFERAKVKEVCNALEGNEVFLSLPIYAGEKDTTLFKQILSDNESLGIYANNYYALNLAKGRKVIASNNLNVFNSFSVLALFEMGVKDIVVSIETDGNIQNCGANLFELCCYKPVQMNFVHCPFKEHFASTCKACKFKKGVIYQMQNGAKLLLERTKAISCNFQLCSLVPLPKRFDKFSEAKYLF